MHIEGIALENFSELPKSDINSTTPSHQRRTVFHYFVSDDSNQDADNNTAQRKPLISLFKDKTLLTPSLSTIWENNDCCAEQYRFASTLYLISVMSQCYSIILD